MNSDKEVTERCQTSGMNPFFQNEEDIFNTLKNEITLSFNNLDAVFFYGAGCAFPDKKAIVKRAIERAWNPTEIFVDTDLLGAARSLCGQKPGIAAILGTGSNSCYYDGNQVVKNISPLGFILGDEGGGSVLGKKLVADVLKGQLPHHICELFFESHNLTPAQILERVYKQPFPNRFLAQFSKFILHHIKEEKSLYLLVKNSFVDFFVRNISHYPQTDDMPVNFTGSIAWHFKDVLLDAAKEAKYNIGVVTKDPTEGLVEYHQKS